MDGLVYMDAVITPNRSLSQRGFVVLIGLAVVLTLGAAGAIAICQLGFVKAKHGYVIETNNTKKENPEKPAAEPGGKKDEKKVDPVDPKTNLGEDFYVYNPSKINQFVEENIQPQWDKLGNNKMVAIWGAVALAGLILWLMSTRLVGAGRRAIREWLETNEPAA